MGRFADRVAVVTGGADGMGAATVERLVAEGARVFIIDLHGDKAEALAARLRAGGAAAEGLAADVSDNAALAAAFATIKRRTDRIDVLVMVAGGSAGGTVGELDLAVWDRLYALNLRSTVHACRQALPLMRAHGRGSIVTMSSISGLRGDPGWGAYNAVKAAIINLTQTLALEEGRHGIRVNAVCPGPIQSARMIGGLADKGIIEDYNRATALGRMGRPEEVANAIAFLASDEASYITGAFLVIDGGLTARTGQPTDFDRQARGSGAA